MCEQVGLHVTDLFRIRIGGVSINDLPEGKWRALTTKERDGLIKLGTGGNKTPARKPGGPPHSKVKKSMRHQPFKTRKS